LGCCEALFTNVVEEEFSEVRYPQATPMQPMQLQRSLI
jgi:hypothetical protein